MRENLDTKKLYDLLKTKENTYFLTFDIVDMEGINAISYVAGNLAIKEAESRIRDYSPKDMVLVYIGEDKFVLVTGIVNVREAQALAQKIIDLNGEPIVFDYEEIPIYMRVGGTKIENIADYCELLSTLNATIDKPKEENVDFAILE